VGANSKIEWTHHTFNPWMGCTKVAAGCEHCYAEALTKRTGLVKWGPSGTREVTSERYWLQPLKWNREAEVAGERRRVFCASLADVFEDWTQPIAVGDGYLELDDVRRELFALIDDTPQLDWLLLTKRPENIRRMMVEHCLQKVPGHVRQNEGDGYKIRRRENVWLGTSIAEQQDADRNIPELLKCRDLASVLFLSCEPLLGPVDLTPWLVCACKPTGECCDLCLTGGPQWVIVGGESGPGARPMHPAWAWNLRNQCNAAEVPFFFKQWGEWLPLDSYRFEVHGSDFDRHPTAMMLPNGLRDDEVTREACFAAQSLPTSFARVGKKAAGRELDGRTWDELPAADQISLPNR
jgi:protein gp37